MQKNSQNFDLQKAKQLAQSPAGQQLLALLQNADPNAVGKASEKAASGDYTGALASLSGLLSSDRAKDLLEQLGR